jgi:hypothetical protein
MFSNLAISQPQADDALSIAHVLEVDVLSVM